MIVPPVMNSDRQRVSLCGVCDSLCIQETMAAVYGSYGSLKSVLVSVINYACGFSGCLHTPYSVHQGCEIYSIIVYYYYIFYYIIVCMSVKQIKYREFNTRECSICCGISLSFIII